MLIGFDPGEYLGRFALENAEIVIEDLKRGVMPGMLGATQHMSEQRDQPALPRGDAHADLIAAPNPFWSAHLGPRPASASVYDSPNTHTPFS